MHLEHQTECSQRSTKTSRKQLVAELLNLLEINLNVRQYALTAIQPSFIHDVNNIHENLSEKTELFDNASLSEPFFPKDTSRVCHLY